MGSDTVNGDFTSIQKHAMATTMQQLNTEYLQKRTDGSATANNTRPVASIAGAAKKQSKFYIEDSDQE